MIFYKETEFKDTEIGRIPKDWEVVKLGNVVEIEDKYRIPVKEQDRQPGPFPYCGANGIIDYVAGYTHDGKFVLLAEDGGFFGPFENSAYIMRGKFWANNHVHILKAIEGVLISEFLVFYLNFINLVPFLTGSTRPKLTQEDMRMIPLPLPSLLEQQNIAEILSTVDDAIQKTNEIIAKTERLKKGLMHELLTKGIGHKEFKDTEIGRIPKYWEVKNLKDVILEAKPGFPCGKRDKNGILQLRMDNIEADGWINTNAGVKVPIPENVEEYLLKPQDILFNNTNSADLIGKTAIFRGEFSKCVYSNHLTRIRVDPSKVVPEWILFLFIRYWQQGIFKAMRHQHVHQAGINKSDLLNLKIPVAPLKEQQKITEILSTINYKHEIERKEKAKLERIKQGLMDLLLTGKVRVRL
jgi:type I restriction enzyme S subunit